MESGPYVDPAGAMLRHQARMERLKQVTNPPPVQAPQHGGIGLGHALTGTAGALAAGALAAKLIPHPVAQGAGLGMQALAATLPHVASIGGMMAGPALVDAVAPGLHEAIDRNAAPIGGAALIGAPLALMALRRRAPAVTPTPPGGAIPVGEMFGPARPSMGGLTPFVAGPRPQAGPQVVRPAPFTPSAPSVPIMEGELVERAAVPGVRGFLTGPRGFLTGPKPAVEAAVPVASVAVPTAVMRPAEITGGPYRAMRAVKLPGAPVLRSGRASTVSPSAIGDMTTRYEVAPPASPVEMTPAMQSILGGIPPRGAGLASEAPAVPGIGGMLNPLKKKVAVAPVTAEIVAPQMRLTKAERPPMRIAELQSALRGVGVTPETAPSLSAADLPTLARKAAEAFNATSRASGARLLTKDEYGYLKEAAHKMSQAPMEHSRVRPAGLVMAEKQSLAEPSPMSKLRTIPEEELAAVPERFEGTRQELFGALAKNIDRQLKLETDPKKRLRIVRHLLIGEKSDIKAAIHEHLGTIAPDVQSRLKLNLKSQVAPVAEPPAVTPAAVKPPTDEGVVEQTAGLKPEAALPVAARPEAVAGVPAAAEPKAPAPVISRADAADRIYAAMGQFRDADKGALVTAKELRAATGLDKATFDTAVSDLAKSGKVMPHKHDFATSLKPEDRDQLVDSAIGSPERADLHANEGRYWVGFAKRREAPAPKIGDNLRIADVDGTLADTETIGGVRYEIYNSWRLKDNRAVVRVVDEGTGNTIHVKQYPAWDAAKQEFDESVRKAQGISKEEPHAVGQVGQQGVGREEHPGGNAGGEAVRPGTGDRVVGAGPGAGQAGHQSPVEEATTSGHVAASWTTMPPEAVSGFEKNVLAPLREQVQHLEGIENRVGQRYAWETAAKNGVKPGDPHAGSSGLERWKAAATKAGLNADALVAANPEYQALVNKLNGYRGWGDEPVASLKASSAAKTASGVLSPDDVLGLIKESPNHKGASTDWSKFAEQYGVNEPFHRVQLPVRQLAELANRGTMHMSRTDQSAVDAKSQSGRYNPVVIGTPKSGENTGASGKPLAVLDGNHSLAAAAKNSDETIDAIVSESAAKFLGIKPASPQEVTGFNVTAARAAMDRRGIAEHGDTNVRATPVGDGFHVEVHTRAGGIGWNRDVLPERYATLEAAQDAAINELQRRSAGNAVAQQAAPAESAIPAHAPEAVAAPAPSPDIPAYKRTTLSAEQNAAAREQRHERHGELYRQLRSLEDQYSAKSREADRTPRSHNKKRAKLQAEADDLGKQVAALRNQERTLTRESNLELIEDQLEKPRSYEHYLKSMTELHDLQRQHHHEMVNTTAKMRELGPALAKSAEEKAAFHQQESDRHALELLDRIKAKVPTDKLNADEIQSVAEDVYRDLSHRSDLESQIAQSVQRRLEHRTAYGKTDIDKMAHLDDAAKSGFKAELDKAVERGPDWFERSKEILARAKSADDAGAEVAAKERAEAAKRAAAEADVRAVEAAQENRQRNRTMMLEPSYFENAKERGNALKGKIQKINEGSIAAEREGVLEREVLNPTWTIDKVLAKDDKGNLKPEFQLKLTAPGQEPVVAMTSGNAANLRQLVVMLEDQGVDMRKYAGKATPDDVQAKWKQTVRAWENDSFGDVDDEFRDTALKNAGATPTNVKADLVLDRADLGYGHTGTHIANATINSTLKPLAEEVPEFGYNPVFTVSNDKRLVFRDHYKYEFAPEAFNLHPNELKPGQTVGINLDDLGIDRSTPEKVVAGMLTNAGWSNVKSGKNGITASAKPGAAPTTFTGSGETWTASGPDASSGQGLLDEIRWTQPGQDAPARTHAGVRIPQKTEPVLELTEPNATTEQMRASRVTLPNPMEAKPAPAVERLTAKPKNMAGKTRESKTAAERPPLPAKSVEMMAAAIESKDVGKLQQMLDPSNKSWRAMFEERTGVKLPRTIRDTKAAIEKWAAPEPPKKLSAREPKPEPEPAPQIERLTGKSFGETVKLHRSGGLDGKTARYAALAEHLNAGGAKTDKAELLRLYDQKKISQIGDADTPEQIRVHLEQASDVPAKERARWQRDLAAPKTGRGASSVESQGKTAKEARNRLEIAAFDMERRADILRSIGSTKADGLRELAQKLRSDINENESQFGEALRAHAETMKAVSAAEESSRQWKPESNSAVHLTPKGLAEEYEHPRWSMSRTLAETGYYTNGKFMLKMPEKLKEQVLAAGGGVKEGRGPDVAAILGQVKNAEREPMRAIGERTIPSFDENGNQLHAQHETIVRDASGNSLIVDSTYLRTVFRSYPDATLHAIPKGQAMAGDAIVVKNDGDIVGVIMGRNRDGLSPEDKAYLKSAPSDVEMKAAPKIKRLSPASGNAPRRVVMSRGAKKLEQRQADAAERAANPASLADVMSGGKAVAPKIERLEGKAEPWRKDATHLTKESLPQAVEALTGEMLDANPKLSENRAKELAAARIRHAIHEKVAEMEKRIRSGTLTPEEEKWYDAIHVDKWSPTRDLERLTGSRTMISDADDPIASLPLSAKIPSGGGLRFPNPYGDSPAGKSYVAAKTEHPDSLVLLRQQNTYELFGDDAKSAAKALGLTLSYLDKNSKNPIAMVGFSQQLLDAYKQKLVAAGHRVAIVEAAR